MSLTSFAFLLGFLPVVAIVAHVLRDYRSARSAQIWITAASLAFYLASGVRYLVLLLASIAFNWFVARSMSVAGRSAAARKRLLWLGLSADILLLGVIKYAKFALGPVAALIGTDVHFPTWSFPLGVSFFTLAQVMYLVDCYEGLVTPSSAFDHLTFVSFFPNITAGPLERVKHFRGQLPDIASPNDRDDRVARAIALIAMGLFKKVVIADSFQRVVTAGYGNVAALSTAAAWITSLSYTFELYFDFSGYSDIAFGTGQLLGISLVKNFNAPFRSKSVTEFWQRWHISLSNFITTYLYTPIVRSMGRVTIHKATVAILIAMTIAGLWHGAAWTFVLFGTLHGLGLATNQYWRRLKRPLPGMLAVVATFAFVNLTMIVFRAPTVATATAIAARLIPTSSGWLDLSSLRLGISAPVMPLIILPIMFGAVAAFAGPTSNEIAERFQLSRRAAAAVFAVVGVSLVFMMASNGADFVYRAF